VDVVAITVTMQSRKEWKCLIQTSSQAQRIGVHSEGCNLLARRRGLCRTLDRISAGFATQRDVSRTKRDIKTFEIRLRVDTVTGGLRLA
jgi:hypothetical protein